MPKRKRAAKVTGIDPGVINLASVTVECDQEKLKITQHSHKALTRKGNGNKITMKQLMKQAKSWWDEHAGFPDSDQVWVEQQKKKKLIFLSGFLLGLAGSRGRLVVPTTWRNAFGIGMGSYAANKQVSQMVCQSWLRELDKQTPDLAEAFLIARYGAKRMGFPAEDEYEIYKMLDPKKK